MDNTGNLYLKISLPKWFVVYMTISGLIVITISLPYTIVIVFNNGFSFFGILLILFCWAEVWFFRYLFYSVVATDDGLKTKHVFGRNKIFLWEEIIEVRNSRFVIPVDFTYVISKNKKKIVLIKSMQNYNKMVDVIRMRIQLQKGK